jgi:hypothetical protein
VWLAVSAWTLVLIAVVSVLEYRRSQVASPPERAETVAVAEENHWPASPIGGAPRPAVRKAVPSKTAAIPDEPVPYIPGLVWGDIDLRDVKAVLPDNLYWELGAPTKDPAVLEAREEEKRRRNEEYGRVLAGDASEEEVNAYYDYRERLSTDFLEIADYMRRRFDSSTNEEFLGMLELAVKLHTARLAQLPADREAALEHSRASAKAREEWQKQQADFASAVPAGPGD